jgi:Flp pilus assembly protein TadG
VGLSAFFLLLGLAVIDYWGTLSADGNLQAIAQAAADAGASGLDVTAYRDSGVVRLNPEAAVSLAMADLQAQPSSELPRAVLGTACLDAASLAASPDCSAIEVTAASVTVILHEEVSSIVLEVAGHHALPITVSATSTATASAYP